MLCCVSVVFKIFKLFGRKIKNVFFFLNYAVLEHIKANVSKQSDENEAVTKKLQDLLKSYEDKLKDLDQALKEANDSVKKANAQNGLNAAAMDDLKVHFLAACQHDTQIFTCVTVASSCYKSAFFLFSESHQRLERGA